MRAFTASPQLAAMTPPKCVLLLMVSGGVSVFQLRSWAGSRRSALWPRRCPASLARSRGRHCLRRDDSAGHVPQHCSVGLIWAHFEHVSLRKVTLESEHAEEEFDGG